ncbi:14133_t:CDS:2, partial [Acaulospora colombiana]
KWWQARNEGADGACDLPLTMSLTPSTSRESSTSNVSVNKQIILEEDEYTEGLSRIIARDFFPTLNHLTAANEYLSALESQDPSLINNSIRTLQDLGPTPLVRHGQTQTPLRTPARNGSQSGPNKRRRYEEDLSLDEYQARYTSEDNASFTEILDEENKKRRERFKWAFEAQRKVMDGRLIEDTKRERMLLEGTGENDARGPKDEAETEEVLQEKEDVILEESSETKDVMGPTQDDRTPYVSAWKFKARNNLMFAPDADESPYHPPANPSIPKAVTEGIREPKSITHSATRLPSPPPETSPEQIVPPSPTRSRIDAAISGVRYVPSGEREEGAAGPNGYNYVPTIPSPSPDQLGPAALKELMTMGTLLSTPRLLSSARDGDQAPMDDIQATPFRINAPSRREQTGHRLSMKASKSIREKAALLAGGSKKGDMAPPSVGMTPKRTAANLTPAARNLLARSTGQKETSTPLRPSIGGSIFDGNSKGSKGVERDLKNVKWTPSPMTRR